MEITKHNIGAYKQWSQYQVQLYEVI